jgi:hypothetical protein
MNKYFMAFTVALLSAGCVTRAEIKASSWLNNAPIPADLCEKYPELKEYGFYRRLNSGNFEFISYCQPCEPPRSCASDFVAFYKADLDKILDKLLPKKKKDQVPSP